MVFLITTLAFVQSLVVAYLLRLRTTETRNYPYIRVLLILIVLHLGIKFFLLGVLNDSYLFGRLTSFTSFAYGPLVYFQYRHSLGKPLPKRWVVIHLLPFFVGFLVYISTLIGQLPYQNQALFNLIFQVYSWFIMTTLTVYPLVLLWFTYRAPAPQSRELTLIRQISWLLLGPIVGGMLFQRIAGMLALTVDPHLVAYPFLGAISFLCLRFFFTNSSQEIEQAMAAQEISPEKDTVSYEKSGLTSVQMDDYWRALETLMQRDKPYLEPEVSLDDLAGKLTISRQHVSQILNLKAGKNFYAYINEYRVNEMLRLMGQKPNARISELALRVGFQSKSTLNTYFRKVTGISPTEYQHTLVNKQPIPNLTIR